MASSGNWGHSGTSAFADRLSMALSVAGRVSLERWVQLGNAAPVDWAADFTEFVRRFYGHLPLESISLHIDGPLPDRSWDERQFFAGIRAELADSIAPYDRDADSQDLDGVVFERTEEIMRLAVESALLFLEEDEGVIGGHRPGRHSARERLLAADLAVSPLATAGLEDLASSLGFDFEVLRRCAEASSLSNESAHLLEGQLLDLRVALLAHFARSLFDDEENEFAARMLSLVPTLDYLVGRVRSRTAERQRVRLESRPWTHPEIEAARRMARHGRQRFEIGRSLERRERDLVQVLGPGEWAAWTELEIDVLTSALDANFIDRPDSLCDLLRYWDDALSRRWECRSVSERSPWDIALRIRNVRFGMPSHWANVGLIREVNEAKNGNGSDNQPGCGESEASIETTATTSPAPSSSESVAEPRAKVIQVPEIRVPSSTTRVCLRDGELIALDADDGILLRISASENVDFVLPETPTDTKSYFAFIRQQIPQAYSPWSEEEDVRLRQGRERDLSVDDLAQAHDRTRGAIESRLARLGLD